MLRGEPTWQTRSIEPMSMPSSSEAVATSAFSSPSLSRCSSGRRRSFERLPWWLATCSSPRRSRQVVRDALGQAARVHEDQRRAVLADEPRRAGRRCRPTARRRRRPRGRSAAPRWTGRGRAGGRGRRSRSRASRLLAAGPRRRGRRRSPRWGAGWRRGRCGWASRRAALRTWSRRARDQREVAAALVAGEGVDLVDDDGADVAQRRAAALGGEHQVERLGRGDQDVGRAFHDRRAVGLRRVAGADGGADLGQVEAELRGDLADLGERRFEVALDVVAERLEGRHVDDLGDGRQRAGLGAAR